MYSLLLSPLLSAFVTKCFTFAFLCYVKHSNFICKDVATHMLSCEGRWNGPTIYAVQRPLFSLKKGYLRKFATGCCNHFPSSGDLVYFFFTHIVFVFPFAVAMHWVGCTRMYLSVNLLFFCLCFFLCVAVVFVINLRVGYTIFKVWC